MDSLIPWELLRMRHPDTDDADDRYFCEYGLVRESLGQRPTRELTLRDWSCLAAKFPADSRYAAVDEHADVLAAVLRGRNLDLVRVEPTKAAALAAIRAGNFDVLHIACHGAAEIEDINSARLIIGERVIRDEKTEPVAVDPVTIGQEARTALLKRRPIVFLDACESGLEGASLTDWGGWPTTFLRRGPTYSSAPPGRFASRRRAPSPEPSAKRCSTGNRWSKRLRPGGTLPERSGIRHGLPTGCSVILPRGSERSDGAFEQNVGGQERRFSGR